MADAAPLLLRIDDAREVGEEGVGGVDHAQVDVEVASEGALDEFALVLAQQAVVDEDAGQLRSPIAFCSSAATTELSTPPERPQITRPSPTWVRIRSQAISRKSLIRHEPSQRQIA